MTKKHFNELARIVGMIRCKNERAKITTELVAMCKQANPNFDAGRFREAVEKEATT